MTGLSGLAGLMNSLSIYIVFKTLYDIKKAYFIIMRISQKFTPNNGLDNNIYYGISQREIIIFEINIKDPLVAKKNKNHKPGLETLFLTTLTILIQNGFII